MQRPESPAAGAAHARAAAWFARGDDRAALAELAAVVAAPASAPAESLVLAANAAIRSRAWAIATDMLEALAAREPDNDRLRRMLATAHNNAGREQCAAGDVDGAHARYARALALEPDLPEALYNRLQLARAEGALAGSRELAIRLLRLQPADSEAALLAAEAALASGDLNTALSLVDRLPRTPTLAPRVAMVEADIGHADAARALLPALDADAASALADRLRGNGDATAARAAYVVASQRLADGRIAPGLRHLIASRLALPWVVDDAAGLAAARQDWIAGLDELEADLVPASLAGASPALEQLAWSNFLLAYQGEDDRALQQRYAALLRRVLATLAPHWLEPPRVPGRSRPRVVLVSSGFRECTVGAYFGAWGGALAAAGWDTHVIQLGPRHDATTTRLIAQAGNGGVVGGTLDAIATSIRALAADVVILPEIGMDMRLQALATVALGARMLAGWGHPVTTGYTHFHGYLSVAEMEPADATSHYVEPLLRLPGLGTAYAAPPAPIRRARGALGLPEGRLYVVPQSAFKLHPEDDDAIALLAAQDPTATIALVPADRPHAQQRHAARLARALSAAGGDPSRLHWLPPLPRAGFLDVLAAADVMFDTSRWSGGNTTLDALRAGLPVVACPGALMRGRQSTAMLHRLGLAAELVVHDRARQVARAIEIANDHAQRELLSREISAGFPALVDGRYALAALVAHVDALRSAA